MPPTPARVPYDACPLCGFQEAQTIGIYDCSRHALWCPPLPQTARWVRCQRCGHVFTDGYFNDAALALLLGRSHPEQIPGHDPSGGRAVSAPMVEAVTALRGAQPDGARWLDVGFGSGALMATAAEYGYDAVGLDLRPDSVALMREFGFEVYREDLCEFQADRPFDVISLCDVLEHMPFPRRALDRARGLLGEGGLLFLSMPNMDAFIWRALDQRRQNPYWGEVEHYHNFGRQRLYALLREHGFMPCRYGISQRYVACMEIVARKEARP